MLSNPTVSTALVGARRISEVEDNIGAIGWQLSDEIRYDIDRIFANFEVNIVPNKWVETFDIDIEQQL